MIGIDIFCGAPPAPALAPAAPPANLIDSSQNIYQSNPLFFDKNAPAPTSATSYYPENPGFVEDPRSLDVNRDFGMTKFVPQWDTPEQAALTGIDAMVAGWQWRLDAPVNEPITSCPICAGRIVERCRCALADGKCENGHEWHRCLVHQRTLLGPSDHSIGADRCQCHRSLTIGAEHARRADCPPLTHCTVGAEGWELNRSIVAGFLLEAETGGAKNADVLQVRAWYDSALKAHESASPKAKAQAEVMMSLLAQRLSKAVQDQMTPGGATDVLRQAVRDVKGKLPDLPSIGVPWWAWLAGGAVALAIGVGVVLGLRGRR